jgi:hypothetical protein
VGMLVWLWQGEREDSPVVTEKWIPTYQHKTLAIAEPGPVKSLGSSGPRPPRRHMRIVAKFGLTAAVVLKADEFVTSEGPTKPMFRAAPVAMRSIRP